MRKKPSSTAATLRTTLELTNDYLSSSTTGKAPSTPPSSTKSRKWKSGITISDLEIHKPDDYCEISYVDIDSLKDEKKRKSLGMWLNGQTRPLIPHMP